MFWDMLFEKADQPTVQLQVLDNIFGFIPDKYEGVVKEWFNNRLLTPKAGAEGSKNEPIKLSNHHCRAILKNKFYTYEATEEFLKDDKSDLAKNTLLTVEAMTPDAAKKEQAWQNIVDAKAPFSSKQRGALMQGFYYGPIELVRPYMDKFYTILPQVAEAHGNIFLESFFFSMLPRREVEDKHIVQLMTIKGQVPDTNSVFSNML